MSPTKEDCGMFGSKDLRGSVISSSVDDWRVGGIGDGAWRWWLPVQSTLQQWRHSPRGCTVFTVQNLVMRNV